MYIFLDVCTSLHILPTAYHIHQVAVAAVLTAKIIFIAAYAGI
jgi:hypothetical protein